jgi:hypothetical protein
MPLASIDAALRRRLDSWMRRVISAAVFERKGNAMKRVNLSLPQFGFVVATRAALGAGLGLLAAERLSRRPRRRLGAALVTIGVLTTVPAVFLLRRGRDDSEREAQASA